MRKALKSDDVVFVHNFSLANHLRWLALAKHTTEPFPASSIKKLTFQEDATQLAEKKSGVLGYEIFMGGGKTVIAAMICLDRLSKGGRVLFICPNRVALGDVSQGIIKNFIKTVRSFRSEAETMAMSRWQANDIGPEHAVAFCTPARLINWFNSDPIVGRKYLASLACVVVDEAHHFPDDDELVVYGKLPSLLQDNCSRDALILSLTGTHTRLDGKAIMTLDEQALALRISAQDLVDQNILPEIYAQQVILKLRSKYRKTGDFYDFHLSGEERRKYCKAIAAIMWRVYEARPEALAAFVRTQEDAYAIARAFNRLSGGGVREIAALVSSTPFSERARIVADVQSGRRLGYVTCAVGAEALDISRIGVVHLIRRTASYVRNAQAIGRGTRHQNNMLVVDYQHQMEGELHGRFVGITLDETAKQMGARGVAIRDGGPMLAKDYGVYLDGCPTLAEQREFVTRRPSWPSFTMEEAYRFIREYCDAA